MTRKEQIEEAICNPQNDGQEFAHGFIAGAEWADANPAILPTCSQVHQDDSQLIIDLIHQRSVAFDESKKWRDMLAIAEEALKTIAELNDHDPYYMEPAEQALGKIQALKGIDSESLRR